MEQTPIDARARIPTPSWRNTAWTPPDDMAHPLSTFQEAFILSAFPSGSRILSARFHRTVRLPCPIWARIALANGEAQAVILRMDYTVGGVEREAAVLPVLARYGLPVPTILAGPVIHLTQPNAGAMTLLTVLPGQDLLSWSWDASAEDSEHCNSKSPSLAVKTCGMKMTSRATPIIAAAFWAIYGALS